MIGLSVKHDFCHELKSSIFKNIQYPDEVNNDYPDGESVKPDPRTDS